MIGDRLLPAPRETVQTTFRTRPSARSRAASSASPTTARNRPRLHRHARQGHADGLEPGHVLAIYRVVPPIRDRRPGQEQRPSCCRGSTRPRCIRAPRYLNVPDERTGILMVFRTFDRVSYAIVLNTTEAGAPRRLRAQAVARAARPRQAYRRMSVAPSERALAWATLAQKGLPGRALAALLRELPDPADVLAASRAELARIVPDSRRRATGRADSIPSATRARAPGSPILRTRSSPGTTPTIRRRCCASATRRPRCSSSAAASCSTGRRSRSSAAATPRRRASRTRARSRARWPTPGSPSSRASRSASTPRRTKARSTGAAARIAVVGTGLDRVYPRAQPRARACASRPTARCCPSFRPARRRARTTFRAATA